MRVNPPPQPESAKLTCTACTTRWLVPLEQCAVVETADTPPRIWWRCPDCGPTISRLPERTRRQALRHGADRYYWAHLPVDRSRELEVLLWRTWTEDGCRNALEQILGRPVNWLGGNR